MDKFDKIKALKNAFAAKEKFFVEGNADKYCSDILYILETNGYTITEIKKEE